MIISLLLVVSMQTLGVGKVLVGLRLTNGQITPKPTLSLQNRLGWHPKGHILSLAQSSDTPQGGSPSLKVTLSSRTNSDCPYIAKFLSASDNLHAGQRIRLSLYVPKGPVIIAAKVFAIDENYNWSSDGSFASFPQGVWSVLDYLLPPEFASSATQVGAQFVSHPLNVAGTVYIGRLEWGEPDANQTPSQHAS